MHLILHIGPPKTGSTSIQRALWQNGPGLEAAGCFHFKARKPAEWALQFLYSGHCESLPAVLRRYFDTVAEARMWSEGCWQLFRAQVDELRPDVVIVSSEHFANLAEPEAFLARIMRGFDRVSVFAYARDPVALYVSELAELIRGGRRFEDLPQVHRARYTVMENLRRFEQVVGADALVVRRYDDPDQGRCDVVRDFFAAVSDRTGCVLPDPGRSEDGARPANRSLCGAATAWLLTLNEVQDIQGAEGAVYRGLMRDRDRVISALSWSPGLSRLPPLTMTDPVLDAVLRWQADDTLRWLNAHHLAVPMRRAAAPETGLAPGRLRARLRDWIMGHITPEAMQAVARAQSKSRQIRSGEPAASQPGAKGAQVEAAPLAGHAL